MKMIAFIAAILSAATVATLAFTTVPSIKKQAADNAAAIEQNAEAIEQNAEAIETLENFKLYQHYIIISSTDVFLYVQFVSSVDNYSIDEFIEYLNNNQITDPENAIGVTGRIYSNNLGSFAYGLYTSNDDLYVVNISTGNIVISSILITNVSLADNGVLLN